MEIDIRCKAGLFFRGPFASVLLVPAFSAIPPRQNTAARVAASSGSSFPLSLQPQPQARLWSLPKPPQGLPAWPVPPHSFCHVLLGKLSSLPMGEPLLSGTVGPLLVPPLGCPQ